MTYRITLNGKVYEVSVEQGEAILLDVADAPADAAPVVAAPPAPPTVSAPPPPPAVQPAAPPAVKGEPVPSPLPGSIVSVKVEPGQAVTEGQALIIIESMKMENEILAHRDGTVVQVLVTKGAVVETGAPLLLLA